jgi:hypothetical protein
MASSAAGSTLPPNALAAACCVAVADVLKIEAVSWPEILASVAKRASASWRAVFWASDHVDSESDTTYPKPTRMSATRTANPASKPGRGPSRSLKRLVIDPLLECRDGIASRPTLITTFRK